MDRFILTKKILPKEGETPLDINDLRGFHNAVAEKFMTIWEKGSQNEEAWLANNWTPEQRADIEGQGRNPYSIPARAEKCRKIGASFRQVRTSVKAEAKSDPNDVVKAELAKLRMRDVESRSESKFIDGDTFDQMLAIKYAVRKITSKAKRDGVERVYSELWDWKDFVWDLNSVSFDYKEKALWCAELEKVTKMYLREKYPNADEGYFAVDNSGSFNGRDKISYYFTQKDHRESDYDLITVFKHYHKRMETRHVVLFADEKNLIGISNGVGGVFKTREEAEAKLRELESVYLFAGLPSQGEVDDYDIEVIDEYVFTYNAILEYSTTDLETFNYDVFFSIKIANKFISFMDFLESPQLWIDRMWMQMDYTFGTDIKNAYQGNVDALADFETPESAEAKATKEGGIIWTKSREKVFDVLQRASSNPDWAGTAQIMMAYLEDFGGGRSFQGLSEGSNESGRAIYNKVVQGQLTASLFFDMFNRAKRNHFRNILSWLKKYDRQAEVVFVHGGALTPEMIELMSQNELYEPSLLNDGSGYVKYNVEDNPMSWLDDADIEIEISEEALSETDRERRWAMIADAEQKDVDGSLRSLPTWFGLKLEAMDLDYSVRQKLMKEHEERQRAMAEQAQQELNIKKADTLLKSAQLDKDMAGQNRPQVSELGSPIKSGNVTPEPTGRQAE